MILCAKPGYSQGDHVSSQAWESYQGTTQNHRTIVKEKKQLKIINMQVIGEKSQDENKRCSVTQTASQSKRRWAQCESAKMDL